LSSPFAEEAIAVTDEDGTVGYTIYPHSYNFEALPGDGDGCVLMMRMGTDLMSGKSSVQTIADVIAVNGTTLGNTIAIKPQTEFISIDGIYCLDTWTELRVDYSNGKYEIFSSPRGFQSLKSSTYGKAKKLKFPRTDLEIDGPSRAA